MANFKELMVGVGMGIKTITFTDRPTAWEWLTNNHERVVKAIVSMAGEPGVYQFGVPFAYVTGEGIESINFTSIVISNASSNSSSIVDTIGYYNMFISLHPTYTLSTIEPIITSISTAGLAGDPDMQAFVTGNSHQFLPDEYWAALGAQLTIYYAD